MSLIIYRRGKIWHYRGTIAHRRLRGSTYTADKETAERIAAQREATEWKAELYGPEAVLTFSQAVSLYLDAQKSDRFLFKLVSYWKDTLVRSINSGKVRQAAVALYPNGSAATRNRHVIVPMQAVINHAADMDLCRLLKVNRAFAAAIKTAYHDTCAVTGIKLINGGGRSEVQAAHIRPVTDGGPDSVRNGLALSGTVHWMFDRGLISVDDDYSLLIAKSAVPDTITRLINQERRLLVPNRPDE